MGKFLSIGFFYLIFPGVGYAQIDEKILRSDFLVIGKVLSDSTDSRPWNRLSYTSHNCRILVVQICIANWTVVNDTSPPTVGSIIHNVQFNTIDSNFRFPSDTLLFFPIMARSHNNYYMQNVERDHAAFSDTGLFSEYCLRKHPEAHVPFPIIKQEQFGKWLRTSEYTADSILVMTLDTRKKPYVSYNRKTKYSTDGQATDIVKTKIKNRGGTTRIIEWCFKRDGKRCFKRKRTRIPLFH